MKVQPGSMKHLYNLLQYSGFYNLIIILVPDLPMRAVPYSLLLASEICPFVLLLPKSLSQSQCFNLQGNPLFFICSSFPLHTSCCFIYGYLDVGALLQANRMQSTLLHGIYAAFVLPKL